MSTAPREMTFLLAEPERRILQALAARVPRSIRSNHLTALGTIAAAGARAAYGLTHYSPASLWAASLLLVLLHTTLALAALWEVKGPCSIALVANWPLAILLTGMVALFVGRFARNLYRLANLEPQRFKWWEQG